jgi:hypothetical protein
MRKQQALKGWNALPFSLDRKETHGFTFSTPVVKQN